MNKKYTKKEPPIAISVGGSLIVPDEIDQDFIERFKKKIEENTKKGRKFIIICGGGKICRRYQAIALSVNKKMKPKDSDWLGIHTTRLNAQLIKSILLPDVENVVIHDPLKDKTSFKKSVLIGAGWKPGCSTDMDAILLAKRFKVKKVINLSNIDYVYTKDPRKNPDAKRIEKISWKEFRKIIPKKWDPGLSSPFDPIASSKAEKLKMEVAIINGKNLGELQNFIENKKFKGTLIK